MRKLGALTVAGFAALMSANAMAADFMATTAISEGTSELSINGFSTFDKNTANIFGGFSYGSFLTSDLLFKLGVNLTYTHFAGSGSGVFAVPSSNTYTYGIRPALSYYFPSEGSTTVPYITGYGNITMTQSGGSGSSQSTYYGAGAGVGVKFFFKQNVAIGPEADFEYNTLSGGGTSSTQKQGIIKLELSAYF